MNNELKEQIIEQINKIPGISKKQASKIVSFFLENKIDYTNDLFQKIITLQNETKKCIKCLTYTNQDICKICEERKRSKKIFVVQDSLNIDKFETLDIEKGKYFVFSENINLKKIEDKTIEKINLLIENAKDCEELILALNTDLNGQITMRYLEKQIRDRIKGIKVYQLSIGIPFGMSIESIDPISLKQSILNKKII